MPAVVAAAALFWVSGALPLSFWTMAALAVLVDARPCLVPGRRASAVILPSISFTFAIALAWGGAPAIAVQLIAVAVAGARMRHSSRRTLHLALQHTAALLAAAAVARFTALRLDDSPGWWDAALICAAAVAWIVARHAVEGLVRGLTTDSRPQSRHRRGRADLLA
ncbi:MAG TPA: GGDEF-domain containing protein, partial [Actinoplanes sp.]|nr:GGDEF-domain containing protein [Actinoplanes sp.]